MKSELCISFHYECHDCGISTALSEDTAQGYISQIKAFVLCYFFSNLCNTVKYPYPIISLVNRNTYPFQDVSVVRHSPTYFLRCVWIHFDTSTCSSLKTVCSHVRHTVRYLYNTVVRCMTAYSTFPMRHGNHE